MSGRTSTSWPLGSSWKHKETKPIRVPVVLEQQIMDCAKALDRGEDPLQERINKFLKIKRRQYRRRIIDNTEMTGGVRWEVFNEFCRWVSSTESTR